MIEQQCAQDRQWGQIVARAWADEAFKARLLADPRTVLREHGFELPPGAQVKVVEDTDRVRHFVLPPSPAGELTDEELSPSAGADSFSGFSGRCGGCGCGCGRCDAF